MMNYYLQEKDLDHIANLCWTLDNIKIGTLQLCNISVHTPEYFSLGFHCHLFNQYDVVDFDGHLYGLCTRKKDLNYLEVRT